MPFPEQVEYFDFVPEKLGRWTKENDIRTLAAARFKSPDDGRTVLILICVNPSAWGAATEARKHALRQDRITQAKRTLGDVLPCWRDYVEEPGNLTLAFRAKGQRTDPPHGGWGRDVARRTVASFPRPFAENTRTVQS